MANSLISMIKGDSTLIDNTEVLNGQLLLDETNKKIYLDDNNERIDFSQGGGETSSDANLAYVEEGTVATRGYAAGAYVIVEGQLYKTLTQINSGTTFITEGVNANVEVTNIGSEVTQLNNDLTKKALVNTYYNSSTKKLYEVNSAGTVGGEISMGTPILDFENPLFSFTASQLTYTVTKECYIVGSICTSFADNNDVALSINGTIVVDVMNTSNAIHDTVLPYIKIKTGDVVTLNRIGFANIKIYDVVS